MLNDDLGAPILQHSSERANVGRPTQVGHVANKLVDESGGELVGLNAVDLSSYQMHNSADMT